MVTIKKTTLGEVSGGHCRSANNCYYTGSTIVWVIMSGDDETGMYYKTKKLAQAIADYANEIGHDCWTMPGDVEMMFYAAHPEWIK